MHVERECIAKVSAAKFMLIWYIRSLPRHLPIKQAANCFFSSEPQPQ